MHYPMKPPATTLSVPGFSSAKALMGMVLGTAYIFDFPVTYVEIKLEKYKLVVFQNCDQQRSI